MSNGSYRRLGQALFCEFRRLVVIAAAVACCGSSLADSKKDFAPAALPHDTLPAGSTDHAARLIDTYFLGYWTAQGITPPNRLDDARFLRRASLGLNGVPPNAEYATAFVENKAADKRTSAVDEILMHSRYADYWAFRLRQWIVELRESFGQGADMRSLYRYLRQAMAENRSWDTVASDLVATQAAIQLDGRANVGVYFDGEATEYAEAAMRLFLGTNVACAKCHDDPHVEQFTRESYWGLAAFFGRIEMWDANVVAKEKFAERFVNVGRSETSVSTLPGGDAAMDGPTGENRALADVDEGEVEMPDGDSPVKMMPTPLGGEAIVEPDRWPQSRRELFVEWMIGQEKRNFARAAVNRFFIELVGRGFVDKADGFTPNATVRHEPLLDLLADEFIRHDFDLKWLMRTIVLSRIFQLEHGDEPTGHGPSGHGPSDHGHWHYSARRNLNSDQWFDSVVRVTGWEETLYGLAAEASLLLEEERDARINERRKLLDEADTKLRAGRFAHLADRLPEVPPPPPEKTSSIDETRREGLIKGRRKYQEAGKPMNDWRGKARKTMSASSEVLMRMNGPLVTSSLTSSSLPQDLAALPTAEQRVEAAFVHVLSRQPTAQEVARLSGTVLEATAETMSDLLWALMQSTEFQTW